MGNRCSIPVLLTMYCRPVLSLSPIIVTIDISNRGPCHVRRPFDCLPTEIKLHILKLLDTESPVTSRINDDPNDIIDKQGSLLGKNVTYDLKAASRVSKEWRALCFPLLFRFMRRLPRVGKADPYERPPVYDIESFIRGSKVVPPQKSWGAIVEGLTVLAVELPLKEFYTRMHRRIVGVGYSQGTVYEYWQREAGDTREPWPYYHWIREIWASIFKLIDPLRVTVLGISADVGFIMGAAFKPHSFPVNPITALHATRPRHRQWPRRNYDGDWTLVYMRPWTHIIINDGYPPDCQSCSLLLACPIYTYHSTLTHLTYINYNPFSLYSPHMLDHIPPVPNFDLVIGPPPPASPFNRLGHDSLNSLMSDYWVPSFGLQQSVIRGRIYSLVAQMLVNWTEEACPVHRKLVKFRIREGPNGGGQPWRAFLQLVRWQQRQDEGARQWDEVEEGWIVKTRSPSVE